MRNTPKHDLIPEEADGFKKLSDWGDGNAYVHTNGLRVIITTSDHDKTWMHISVSRAGRLPSHAEMYLVKNTFMPNHFGYTIMAPVSQHINIHPYCLHIWIPLFEPLPIPNFGEHGTI